VAGSVESTLGEAGSRGADKFYNFECTTLGVDEAPATE
jgi:hypothetical protein